MTRKSSRMNNRSEEMAAVEFGNVAQESSVDSSRTKDAEKGVKPGKSMKIPGDKGLLVLAVLAIALVAVALVGPFLIAHSPVDTDTANAFRMPDSEYLLGTDNLGRCMLCRIVAGLGSALFSALFVVAIALVIGTALGVAAGFAGGIVDRVVMWLITSFQVFPSFLLAVVIAGFLGPGIMNACIALIVVYWTTFARMSRSLVLALKERTFVKAAALNGCSPLQVVVKHLVPNISTYMLVIATGDVGGVILSMSGLSFLGLGAQRPTSDWGVMLAEFQKYVFNAPQLMLEVGICLSLVVLIYTLLGDKLRDYLDAKQNSQGNSKDTSMWENVRRKGLRQRMREEKRSGVEGIVPGGMTSQTEKQV